MKKPGFTILFLLLMILQVLLMQFFTFSRFVMVSFLPVMILCIPIEKGTIFSMIVAFVTGLAIDFLGDGMLGLTSISLVPVALCRLGIIRLVFGQEVLVRRENVSRRKQGIPKMLLASLLSCSIFILVYVLADAAGTRPFWLNAVKILCSILVSTIVSFFVADLLTSEEKWR